MTLNIASYFNIMSLRYEGIPNQAISICNYLLTFSKILLIYRVIIFNQEKIL